MGGCKVPVIDHMADPLHLIRPVAIVSSISVDDALATGVWEGFCEISCRPFLAAHGAALTPGHRDRS